MRIAYPLSVLAAVALLLGGTAAYAQQQKNQPKGQGAGTECSRITDAKKRDECVHQAQQQKERAAKDMEKKGSGATKNDSKGKKN